MPVCNDHNTLKKIGTEFFSYARCYKKLTTSISAFNATDCLYQWLSNFSDHSSQQETHFIYY